MRRRSTTSSWPFPPETREVQFDEKWNFVGKKEKACDPANPADARCGDNWDHTAVDPEHRLLLAIVPDKRTARSCEALVGEVKQRTGGRTDLLITSDEHAPYATAIKKAYGTSAPESKVRKGSQRSVESMPDDLCYATVCKTRKRGRVVNVVRIVVFGALALLTAYLARSKASSTINTSFVERNNGTDRGQNARKARKTYCFSKDWSIHIAMTFFVAYTYNFCWPVRTLRHRSPDGLWEHVTPAMAAGLADHVWTLLEWITLPARPP